MFQWRLVLLAEETVIDEDGSVHILQDEDNVSACYIGQLTVEQEQNLQVLKALYHWSKLTKQGVAEAHSVMRTLVEEHRAVIEEEDRRTRRRLTSAGFTIRRGVGFLPPDATERQGTWMLEQPWMSLRENGQEFNYVHSDEKGVNILKTRRAADRFIGSMFQVVALHAVSGTLYEPENDETMKMLGWAKNTYYKKLNLIHRLSHEVINE
eukprot:NODE_4374_length_681_cov_1.130990.p1 GENE.NODE_4374_length_681_cov_1.130990~~NODE_4374_length_681_cov_1.130990.p1  ORF type:complete len:225 (-),score=60.35 NODE_4374_length_681_cov_1.130990:5-631(-)